LKAGLKGIGNFMERELISIRKFFDLDGDGEIAEEEFMR